MSHRNNRNSQKPDGSVKRFGLLIVQLAVVWCISVTLKIHFQDAANTPYCTQWQSHCEQPFLQRLSISEIRENFRAAGAWYDYSGRRISASSDSSASSALPKGVYFREKQ